jgi:putative spermidine/putrescine transport system permease protein
MHRKGRYIILVIIGAICLLPALILLLLSFARNWIFPHLLPDRFSTDNWTGLLDTENNITSGFFTSLLIAILVALLATVAGFITSRHISYHKNKRRLLFYAYFPFALSPVVFAACLRFYFIKLGLVGNLTGVITAQIFIAFPYSIIFFTSFWNEQVEQFRQLVHTLGGTDNYASKKIIWPLAKPFCIVCFFQCFLISWFEYGLTSMIGFGKVQTLTIAVFQFIGEANIFQAALSCSILIIPPVILLWVNKKFIFNQGR